MENVFGYFVAIGAGLSFGLTLGAIPIIWFFTRRKKEERKVRVQHAK